jgi:hypothetical protein
MIDSLAEFQNFLDVLGWNDYDTTSVSDDIVVLIDGDSSHLRKLARGDLHNSIACTDHGDTTSIYWIADVAATIDVSARTINDGASNPLSFRSVGKNISPA